MTGCEQSVQQVHPLKRTYIIGPVLDTRFQVPCQPALRNEAGFPTATSFDCVLLIFFIFVAHSFAALRVWEPFHICWQ